jgi:hypothetical protein
VITYHRGDATDPQLDGEVAIVHILSDSPNGHYDAGFAKALGQRHPAARDRFKLWAAGNPDSGTHRQFQLGASQWVAVGHDISQPWWARWVINMVAQHGLRSKTNPHPLDLDALDQCLGFVAGSALGPIVMPRIGCGLAGGDWDTEVEPLIGRHLGGHDVHVYDLS